MYLCFGLVCRSHFPTSHDTVKKFDAYFEKLQQRGLNTNLNKIIYCIKKSENVKKCPRAFFEKQIESYLLRERIAYYYFTESSLIN